VGRAPRGRIFVVGAAIVGLVGVGVGVAATRGTTTTPHGSPSPLLSPSALPGTSAGASPVPSPLINAAVDAVDEVGGTALVQFTPGSHLTVAATAGSPGRLAVDPQGRILVQVSMTNAAGDVFSIAGPAAVGTVTSDQVSVLDTATGLTLDSTQGDSCTVTYSRVAENGVQGTAHCSTRTGTGVIAVTAPFHLFLLG
jgi:hypothetical protein